MILFTPDKNGTNNYYSFAKENVNKHSDKYLKSCIEISINIELSSRTLKVSAVTDVILIFSAN